MAGEIGVLKKVYGSPYYVLFNVAVAVFYYYFFHFIFSLSGIALLLTLPSYMIYALSISASLLLTVSAYAVVGTLHRANGVSTGFLSAVTTAAGSVVASCSCQAPILGTALYAIGFNTLAVSGVLAVVGTYQTWFFTALILINLLFFYYTLHRTASRLPKGQLRSIKVRMKGN